MLLKESKLLNIIANKNLENYLVKCNFGLEKENVRVDGNGVLAFTPHPKAFGDRLTNPYIKTDFSESQVEVSTPVCKTIGETYDSLEKLHDKVSLQLKDEYLWTQSTPPYLPKGKEIPIAVMGDKDEEAFRAVLAKKYGSKKQLISGIHYNFSFNEGLIKILYKELSNGENFIEFKNTIYLKISKNFMKYRWLPIYLTGASPVFHSSFLKEYTEESLNLDNESFYFPNMVSLRNSNYGYKNINSNYVSFNSLKEYINDIDKLVNKGELQDIYEFYNPVRLKRNSKNLTKALIDYGIEYIEIRILDLNPLYKIGISKASLNFIHLFMLYMLFKEEEKFGYEEYVVADKNADLVSFCGRKPGLNLYNDKNKKMDFKVWSLSIITEMQEMLKLLKLDSEYYSSILDEARGMVADPDKTFSARIIKGVKEKSFINFHMEKANEYLQSSKRKMNENKNDKKPCICML